MKKEQGDGDPAPPPVTRRFKPRVPPKKTKLVVPKKEPVEIKNEVIDKELLQKLRTLKSSDGPAKVVPKAEQKVAPSQFTFGQRSSSVALSFPIQKKLEDELTAKVEKEYVEPWDYSNSNYPVTLPLRRPYSGDPEILDEEEFGESSTSNGHLRHRGTPAEQLGLLERTRKPQLIFFQLPSCLPIPGHPKAFTGAGTASSDGKAPPSGFMGKILVYRSGKMKMKVGDALFDVRPGSDCSFAEDAAVVNTEDRRCADLGPIVHHAVVTPDVDSMLDHIQQQQ